MIDRIREPESPLAASAAQAKERALEVAATAKERLAIGSAWVRGYTQTQPARALGLALGMGVFLGWLIKRR